ncbi:hypothetical protein ACFL6I_03055 [candidate division KSB1 bacterium]
MTHTASGRRSYKYYIAWTLRILDKSMKRPDFTIALFLLPVLLVVALRTPAAAQVDEGLLQFKNMSLGIGVNISNFDILYSENDRIFHTGSKQSMLIDLRANFYTSSEWEFSSLFQLWSWTDNPGSSNDDPQNGMNDFAFMFDLSRHLAVRQNIQLYGGGGMGVHFLNYWTNFPLDNPYFDRITNKQLRQISVQQAVFAPDILAGIEYELWEGMYITSEARYEFGNSLRQWKFLMSISIFD